MAKFPIKQPTVVLGITGCIAAYKACEIVRGLQKAGVRVKVCMTEHATEFVGPTTFRGLTREPVAVDLFDAPGNPIHHVSLAQEGDVFCIAPCTGNMVAKMANGIADDLLSTTALAVTAPTVIAPAMNVNMYEAAATQENFQTLRERGVRIVEADEGYLACGDVGKGRLADPATIVAAILDELQAQGHKLDLVGKRVMITTGPTVEPIDPVRFISNPSSGKTGWALAQAAAARGAEITLISGPVALDDPEDERIRVVRVKTALDMLDAAQDAFGQSDIAIFSAAVSDYRVANPADRKLKKGQDDEALATLQLVPNPDVLATCAAQKREGQFVVGYAAETENVIQNAQAKLTKKNADMIVANDVSGETGFGSEENTIHLVKQDEVVDVPSASKEELAHVILDACL